MDEGPGYCQQIPSEPKYDLSYSWQFIYFKWCINEMYCYNINISQSINVFFFHEDSWNTITLWSKGRWSSTVASSAAAERSAALLFQ